MEKPIVSKIKIRVENSDGTWNEVTKYAPQKIGNDLSVSLMEWEENYVGKPKSLRAYFGEEEKFIKKNKK